MALDFSTYPPKGHQERIAAYLRFEKLFLGQASADRPPANLTPRLPGLWAPALLPLSARGEGEGG